MLSTATIASIAGILKVPAEALTAAIADKAEVGIKVKTKDAAGKEVDADADFTGLKVFTTEEYTTLETNLKEGAKNGHINAGKEIGLKEFKQKAGLEIEGKDPDKILEALKTKILAEAKINPDARVTELNEQIRLLKEGSGTATGQLTALQKELADAKRDTQILSSFPNRNPLISDQDYLLMVKNRFTPEIIDGKEVYKDAQGNVYRNSTAGPLALKEVIGKVFAENTGWAAPVKIDPKTGRAEQSSAAGGGGGGTPTKYSEAYADFKAKGGNVNGADFQTYVSKLAEGNKTFEMDIHAVVDEPAPATP